jgi:hypothetical protein
MHSDTPYARRRFARNAGAMSASESSDEIDTASSLEGNAASSSSSISHGGLSRARLVVVGSGEGELRSSSISQTASSPVRPAPLLPLLLLLGRGSAGTAGAEVVADADVVTDAEVVAVADAAGAVSASPAVPVRKGRSNASLSLATFFGPKPGRRSSCAASACAIFAKLCVPRSAGKTEGMGEKSDARRRTCAGSRRLFCSRAGCS